MNGAEEATPPQQLIVIARLAEFCQWRTGHRALDRDPWLYMRDKLLQIEEPLAGLKNSLYAKTVRRLLEELKAGPVDDERFSDYRLLFEKLLSRGDFADLAIHLSSKPPPDAAWIKEVAAKAKPHNLFVEERLPAAERSPSWEKLVCELYDRLGLDLLGKVLERKKPRTAKRRSYILRRQRWNVAEYCTVVHVPLQPSDTFTPFMLPRIEAIIAANLRFLNRYR